MSEECLYEAIEGYAFTSEVRNILEEAKGKSYKEELEGFLPGLEDLQKICPKDKVKEIESMIKIIEEAPAKPKKEE